MLFYNRFKVNFFGFLGSFFKLFFHCFSLLPLFLFVTAWARWAAAWGWCIVVAISLRARWWARHHLLVRIINVVIDVKLLVILAHESTRLAHIGEIAEILSILVTNVLILHHWLHFLVWSSIWVMDSFNVSWIIFLVWFKIVWNERNIMNYGWLGLEIWVSPVTGSNPVLGWGPAVPTVLDDVIISRQWLGSRLDRTKHTLFWSVLLKNYWFQILLALHEGTHRGCWIDLSEAVIWLWSIDKVSKSLIRLIVFLLLLLDDPLKAIDQIFIIFVGFKNIKAWK